MADEPTENDDFVKVDQVEDKDKYIEQLQAKIKALEDTNKQQRFEVQRAIHANGANDGKDELNGLGPMGQFNKQISNQHYIDADGHKREVSMPGFHKQFTMNFAEEINDLSAVVNIDGNDVDVNDPDMSTDLKRAYLEIQQLQKQLAQFTEQARDERALIWEKPRLTIQQISTFLRKLPDKHKEKMWERHCMGEYVKIDKVGSLLFSIVALCIKIHDRNVKTPQKGALLKKLEPYTKLLQSQIQQKDDPTGLTQEDFNDSLHEWLLLPLPIENLLNTTDREKLESELFETRKQLIEKDKEIIKERRKSKLFHESLQHLQQEQQIIEEKDRRASAILDEKDQLKLELAECEKTIEEQKQRIDELEAQVTDLTLKLNKARDSEDETLPERQPNGHTYYSQERATAAAHVIQPSDNPFEEEKIDYSVNDSNIVKSDIYLGWKRKADRLQEQLNEANQMVQTREQTVEELQSKISQYETMADAYRTLQADNSKWKEKVQTMTDKMNEFERSHADPSKSVRRESIAQLHNTMARGMLYAEAEHEKIVSGLERQISNLQSDCNYITNEYEKFKNESEFKLEQVVKEKDNEFDQMFSDQKQRYEQELQQEQSKLASVQQQMTQIMEQLRASSDLEQDNIRLTEQVEYLRKNKQACMNAAAEGMNELRSVIRKLNEKLDARNS